MEEKTEEKDHVYNICYSCNGSTMRRKREKVREFVIIGIDIKKRILGRRKVDSGGEKV